MAQLSKIRGAQKVIMIDINQNRLDKALEFGVDITIDSSKEDPIEAVKKLTNGKGADKVISALRQMQLRHRVSIWLRKAAWSYSSVVYRKDP